VFEDGAISRTNATAARRGARVGEPLGERLRAWARLA